MFIIWILAVMLSWSAMASLPPEISFSFPDRRDKVCFFAEDTFEEKVTCQLGMAGVYPPQSVAYGPAGCCFDAFSGEGVFWALGEQHLSRVMDISNPLSGNGEPSPDAGWAAHETPSATDDVLAHAQDVGETSDKGVAPSLGERLGEEIRGWITDRLKMAYGGERHAFVMEAAVLADLLVLDAADDAPIEGGYVTVSDDAVHLVHYVRSTDEDGYAVLPMIAGEKYVVMLRVSGYLQPEPIIFMLEDAAEEFPQKVVTVHRGVTLSGQVLDTWQQPVGGAKLIVSVYDEQDREIWNSTLDRPKAFDKVIEEHGAASVDWAPERPSMTCDAQGRFKIEHVPLGKLHVYAVTDGKMPSGPVVLDAREAHVFESLVLRVVETCWAWFRITDEHDVPLEATVSLVDKVSGYAPDPISLPKQSAARVEGLPSAFQLTIYADGYETVTKTMACQPGDEFVFALKKRVFQAVRANVQNTWGEPLDHVRVTGMDDKGKVVCAAATEKDGTLFMEMCPRGVLLSFTKEGYAPFETRVMGEDVLDVTLSEGVVLRVVADGDAQLSECSIYHDVGTSPSRQLVARQKAVQGRVVFEHLARRKYVVQCTSDSAETSLNAWEPTDGEADFMLSVAFEKRVQIDGIVTEAYGAPVPYAEVVLDKDVLQTDEYGRFQYMTLPSRPLRVQVHHWLYGQLERRIEPEAFRREIELRLEEKAPTACAARLEEDGVVTVVDGSSLRIDGIRQDSVWQGKGMKRGDYVESCDRALVIVRDDKRLVFQFE